MKRILCAATLALSALTVSGCATDAETDTHTGGSPRFTVRWVNMENNIESATGDYFSSEGGTMTFLDSQTKHYRYIHSDRWEVSENY